VVWPWLSSITDICHSLSILSIKYFKSYVCGKKRLRCWETGVKLWEEVGIQMGRFFFSGSVNAKLDDKNRFVLPQNMRYGLVEEGAMDFTIGLGLGGCLAIYRRSDIDKIIANFQQNQHIGKLQPFFTLFFSTLYHTTCDKIGRVSIPPNLKKAIDIKNEIVVAGVLNKIELWPKEVYEAQLNTLLKGKDPEFNVNKLMEEAFGLLGAHHD
jgi:MraZ protein